MKPVSQLALSLVSISLFAASSASAADPAISFDLMHTRPETNHEGKPKTWCELSDTQAVAALSGMEARAAQIIDAAVDPAVASIKIAYFSFSNKAVLEKLCEKGKAGISIEGFFDNDYRGPEAFPAKLKACAAEGRDNIKLHFLGEKDFPAVWRLHHNKFLMVDPGNGEPVRLNFSSGNLSSFGLSCHFDHWVVLQAPKSSNLVKQHACVVEGMRESLRQPGTNRDAAIDDADKYREALERCLVRENTLFRAEDSSWVEEAIAKESIAPLFAPNPADAIYKTLRDQIRRVRPGGRISGAVQHFKHSGIAAALRAAVARGVEVNLIMDDDVLLGDSEVPGVRDFYDEQIEPSISGIDVRFMQTNSTVRQMMHHKFLILESPDMPTRVFSGAGHFTSSAMRNNYENFYLSQDAGLAGKYVALFGYMWSRAVGPDQVESFE